MAPALLLLAMSTFALGATALWPRAGQGVRLALPPGASASAAFAAEEWRVRSVSSIGPFTLILALPETPLADPARLRRIAGASLAWLAAPPDDCRQP